MIIVEAIKESVRGLLVFLSLDNELPIVILSKTHACGEFRAAGLHTI